MSKVFFVIALFVVVLVDAKGLKKASSAKPTKTPKSVVDQFAGLPEEDVKFIKELDKQFKLHGDKIKIRIERENTTTTSGKNSKRTIDGELGYGGYRHRNHRPGSNFYFSKPKLEYYPYSQEDIPPLPPVLQRQLHQQQLNQQLHHRNRERLLHHPRQPYGHSVEIQQSPGYEIRENIHFDHPPPPAQPYHQDFQQPAVYQHAEPVIVLKIPGPQKYAAHLKVLLQQYLEMRAAQYIQELEEQEHANQHGNSVVQDAYVEEHIPETNGHTLATAQPGGVPHPVYGPPGHEEGAVEYVHQEQPVHQEVPVEEAYEAPQQGQTIYETHEVHYAPQQAVFINQGLYQHDTQSAYQGPAYLPAPEQQSDQQYFYQHGDEQHQHQTQQYHHEHQLDHQHDHQHEHQHEHHHEDENLPSSENYPSDHHTRVIFRKELHAQAQHQSVTPAAATHVEYQQEYQHTPTESYSTAAPLAYRAQEYYQPHEMEMDDIVAITQKPHNYHAHPGASSTLGPVKSAKRDVPPYTEEQFKKLSKLVHKLKRKQEQAVEPSN
ncbi:hypothetical protein DMENIID0001_043430 [Sergentomyia squamirostris]